MSRERAIPLGSPDSPSSLDSKGGLARPARLRSMNMRNFGALGPAPSRGLPTVAHANVGKRERRLVPVRGFEPRFDG